MCNSCICCSATFFACPDDVIGTKYNYRSMQSATHCMVTFSHMLQEPVAQCYSSQPESVLWPWQCEDTFARYSGHVASGHLLSCNPAQRADAMP